MSKVNFKNLINKIRQSLKISGSDEKQLLRCIDEVIIFLKSSLIDENHAKIYSSFLSNFLYLLKNVLTENKINNFDDDEKYIGKLSFIFSFFIESEIKRLLIHAKDNSKINPTEKLFVESVIVKSRICSTEVSDVVIVRALLIYFARNNYDTVEFENMVKSAALRLLKKMFNLKTTIKEIDQKYAAYYEQLFVIWLKIANKDDENKIHKIASDLKICIEPLENGKSRYIEEISDVIVNNFNDKVFNLFNSTDEEIEYKIDNIEWIKKLESEPSSNDKTIDLTVDSDDSDVELELEEPSELILIDDNDLTHNIPFPTSSKNSPPKIGIQLRYNYIQNLNDTQKPLSFTALRRKSLMEEERKKTIADKTKRRKSANARFHTFESTHEKDKMSKKLQSFLKKFKLKECIVSIKKISDRDIAQLRKKKLQIKSLEKKYGVEKKVIKRRKRQPKKSPVAPSKKISNYPDHTKPNISLSQIIDQSATSSTNNQSSLHDKNYLLEEPSIPIVNWDYSHLSSINSSPNHLTNSHAPLSPFLSNNRIENFDAISDNEQNSLLESTAAVINKSILEDVLGERAYKYLPDVHASILSTLSRSSQSADELAPTKDEMVKTNEVEKKGRKKKTESDDKFKKIDSNVRRKSTRTKK